MSTTFVDPTTPEGQRHWAGRRAREEAAENDARTQERIGTLQCDVAALAELTSALAAYLIGMSHQDQRQGRGGAHQEDRDYLRDIQESAAAIRTLVHGG